MRIRRQAFTLVELLVVIGIIALLIGILLPALNRARQQANLVSCSSRLRQMGEALSIYESENKGRIPLSEFGATDPTFKQGPSYLGQFQWYWVYALGQELTHNNIIGGDGTIHSLPPIFGDVDTVPKQTSFAAYPLTFACHYMCNPRVFLDPLINFGTRQHPIDILKGPLIYGRSASDIKHSADVFAIWDAPQEIDRGYNSYPVAQTIDANAVYTNGLMYLTTYAGAIDSSLPIYPDRNNGMPGVGNGASFQKADNFDGDSDTNTASTGVVCLRFRHMNNTKLAALCVDGHVETRLVGAVLRKDIYTNVMGTTND